MDPPAGGTVVPDLPQAGSLTHPSPAVRTPIIIAHRGASAYAPEHTFAAYDLGLEAGADYIEQDLQLTADGELIVMHDGMLDRTTGGTCTGSVIEKNFADIADCDVGSWFNIRFPQRARAEYSASRIPRLTDVFDRYAGRARFYIETKSPADAPGMEEKLVALIERYGLRPETAQAPALLRPAELPTVIFQSFSAESLRKLRKLAPGIPRVQLIESDLDASAIIAQLPAILEYAQAIGPARTAVNDALTRAAHDHGLAVHPYTVNDEVTMRALIGAGVDGIFTDDPARLVSLKLES